MKKIMNWIIGGIIVVFSFLFGFLIRQPKVNKLKEQVKTLQKDRSQLYSLCEKQHNEFKDLLVQHKALKAFQFKKKSTSKEQLAENLVMQYAIWDYVHLLLDSVKNDRKLNKEEAAFFWSFEKFINGEKLSTGDKVKIRDYATSHHEKEIKELRECNYEPLFVELQKVSVTA